MKSIIEEFIHIDEETNKILVVIKKKYKFLWFTYYKTISTTWIKEYNRIIPFDKDFINACLYGTPLKNI